MLNYKDYQEQIYNWLCSKNTQNREFTFSVRRKSAKGAESNYFIGTERSGYFATTFWFLPVSFPGSSGDCIALLFFHSKQGLNYTFELTQTKAPHDEQNKSALNLCKSLEEVLAQKPGLQRGSSEEAKMFTLRTKPNRRNYQSVEDLTNDIDLELDHFINEVNEKIALEQNSNSAFNAHRISPNEFTNNSAKMHDRISRFSNEQENVLQPIKYWLYAPGENARKWDEFYDSGIMGLGWDNLGDLNDYDSKERITEKLQELENTTSHKGNDTMANYDFKEGISIGDIIIAKKGRKEYIGYGIVTSDYFYDKTRTDYQKCRNVDWKKKGVWSAENNDIVLKTLTDITNYKEYVQSLVKLIGIGETDIDYVQVNYNDAPLNQIFYGPPGTGKTYHTVLEAAKIVTGNEFITYDEALKVFNENLGTQIEFITFHQNYSYEDFIQGLRPDTGNGTALTFEKKDGVFKRIADRAYKNLQASMNPAAAKKDFDIVFQELIKPLNDGDVEELEIKMKKSNFYITEIGEKSIEFRKNIGESQHTLSINTLRRMYDNGVNDIIFGGLQPYYNPILALLLEKGKSALVPIEQKNYVIIIDEINRANISRVFGELITLIEEDKRSHGKIPMRVTLPSGDTFIVPSNLYLIGTMNTADKSIALLDIALRRRFEFVPMYPDVTLDTVHDKEILTDINTAILKRKSHDFTIGHAYFMGENYSRKKTINHKVIPLLLEYFMNDEKEVIAILKEANVTVGSWPLKVL